MEINKDETIKHFESIATNYGVNEHGGNVDKSDSFFEELLPVSLAPHVIECGGGGGLYTIKLLRLGYRVTTIDLSKSALEVNYNNAKRENLHQNLTIIHGDFNEIISSLQKEVHQVLFIKVLHHFDNLEEIKKSIHLSYQILQEGGKIIIFEPNGKNPIWKPAYLMKKNKETGKSLWFYEQNLKLITRKNLLRIINPLSSNYCLKYKYVLPGFIISKKNVFSFFFQKLNEKLENSFFKVFSFNLLLTLRKKKESI